MGFLDKIVSVKDYLAYDHMMQDRGYKPVMVLSTVSDYDKIEERRILVNTLPMDVRARDGTDIYGKKTSIMSSLKQRLADVGSDVRSSVTDITGKVSDKDRALEGCMIDLTVAQGTPQLYSWANVIFQNPLIVAPSGDKFFGSDFLKVGFPIWFQLGYVNNVGKLVSHPFDMDEKLHLPVLFAGLIGALDQEITMESGDRLLVMAAGFRWYFVNFTIGQTKIVGGKISIKNYDIAPTTTLEDAITVFFERFLEDGGKTAPKGILSAMGINPSSVVGTKDPINLKWDELVDKDKLPTTDKLTMGKPMKDNYLTALSRLENLYQVDINWVAENTHDTVIQISPRLDPHTMATKSARMNKEDIDKKIHQIVLGGNVRNWTFGVDAVGTVNRLAIKIVDPASGEVNDTFLMSKKDIGIILEEWSQASGHTTKRPRRKIGLGLIPGSSRLTGFVSASSVHGAFLQSDDDMSSVFGDQTRLLELVLSRDEAKSATAPGPAIPDRSPTPGGSARSIYKIPYSLEAMENILRRLHYWGTRGSVMIMGNADVHDGDLIEVFDKRPKGTTLLGFDAGVTTEVMSSFKDRIAEKQKASTNQCLGLAVFKNIYYIWKVCHYFGPQGYWTKIWFVKQRDALGVSKSAIFQSMRKRSKRKED